MNTKSLMAVVASVLAAVAFLVGVEIDHHALRLAAKPIPVLIMAVLVFSRARHTYGRWIGAGLLASLLGDVLLEISDTTFLHGVGAFLVGHVLYSVAYLQRSRNWRLLLALPFAAWGIAVVTSLRPGLEAAGMLIPVGIYSAAIMVMLWRAAACWEEGDVSDITLLALVGALLFAVSDTMIAIGRFDQPFAGIRYWIILLYWIGQTGITLSALRFRQHL